MGRRRYLNWQEYAAEAVKKQSAYPFFTASAGTTPSNVLLDAGKYRELFPKLCNQSLFSHRLRQRE